MSEAFTFLTDSEGIPVCAYQIGANALNQVLFVPVKVTDEVQTTDASGFFQCAHYPVLDINGDGALTAVDVLPRNNGSGVALYVGTAAADLDSNAGKFKLYSDAGLTTAVASTACKCTYYYALPGSVDSSGGLVLGASTAIVGKVSIDQVTANANEVVIKSITAGDNNIGNIDIVTLPSGNLGQKTAVASLSVAPATDIADATYIGDIKFGEALPAGTNLLGKTGIDQTTPGTTNGVQVVATRNAGALHRSAITSIDKCTTITITAADSATAGSLTAVSHGIGVAPGNSYGTVGVSALVTQTPTVDKSIDITIPQSTGATYYDIFLSTATDAPLWVARITEAQRAAGCAVTAVGTVGAGGSAGVVNVQVVGTGLASTNAIFVQNNAYTPAAAGITPIDTTGKTKAYIYASVTVTDLRSAPMLTIVPFIKNQVSTAYHQCQSQTVYLLTALGQSQDQVFELDLDGAVNLAVLVDTISGQGTAVTIHVELV